MSKDDRSLMLLWQKVLEESGTWCRTSTALDLKKAQSRFETEGLSFLTITLANFGKDFEKALSQGYVGDDLFAGFKRKGGLPLFLGGFLHLVFEPGGTAILADPSIDAIHVLRQITLMLSKVEVPCSETRNRKAIDGYVQIEEDLREQDRRGPAVNSAGLRRVFALLYAGILQRAGQRIDNVASLPSWAGETRTDPFDRGGRDSRPVPRHGPGATADRKLGNEKFRSLAWTQRLEHVFPSSDYLIPNHRYAQVLYQDGAQELLEPGAEVPVKVTLVPKTLKTPRIIAEEPTCMQYAQQAIWRVIREEWEKDKILSSLVTFRDQEPNKDLARKGSIDGTLATLDLSEASDRVSNSLVRDLFGPWTSMAEALDATRSRKANVPGKYGVIRLAKFASMGSALCFPVETMVFLAIICLSWEEHMARPIRPKDLKALAGYVRVFGDDMIVPAEIVPRVISNLEAFGFKVNANKSFWTGKFRESCGGDYYDGHDVSIVKVRQLIPTRRKDVAEVEATVALRNRFYYAGFWNTCQWLDQRLERLFSVKGISHYPIVDSTSVVLGRHSFLPYKAEKMCDELHRPLVKGFVTRPVIPENPLDDVAALLKFFVMRGEEPLEAGHLERSGRPRTVDIKTRWTTPF